MQDPGEEIPVGNREGAEWGTGRGWEPGEKARASSLEGVASGEGRVRGTGVGTPVVLGPCRQR